MRTVSVAVLLVLAAAPVRAQRADTVVRTISGPRHPGGASLVLEVTIGGVDADEDALFDRIRAIAWATDGRLWVADGAALPVTPGNLRLYDENGRFVRRVGRQGRGPGEWYLPSGLAGLPDGRVVMSDAEAGRPYTVYRADGSYDTTWSSAQFTSIQRSDRQGVVWSLPVASFAERGSGSSGDRVPPYLLFDSRGRLIDSLPRTVLPQFPVASVRVGQRGENGVSAPFSLGRMGALSPLGYQVTGSTDRYAVDLRVAPASRARDRTPWWHPGDPVISLRGADPRPVELSQDEWRDRTRYLREQVDALGGRPQGPIPAVPRQKQLLRSLSVDEDGRIWVWLSAPSERYDPPAPVVPRGQRPPPVLAWREPMVADVIEPSGTYLGRVQFPGDITSTHRMVARGDRLWVVVADGEGVETLRRYRIVWR